MALEQRIEQLETQVATLQKQMATLLTGNSVKKNPPLPEPPDVEIKIWLRALRITSEEYHWINYFSYHMFLTKLLVRHCERCMPLPFQQYYGKLYIVSTEQKKWKIIETADLQNILENVSISVHEYFETNIEPLLQDEETNEKRKEQINQQFGKMNEGRFRKNERMLREVRKKLMDHFSAG